MPAAPGVADQFEGPFYRFLSEGAPQLARAVNMSRKYAKEASSPEDFMRKLRQHGLTDVTSANACDWIDNIIGGEEVAAYDGVVAFSEGACAAASMILRHLAREQAAPFKLAIFFCASPPLDFQSNGAILADECLARINIPTAHIVGSADPGYLASKALYNLCEKDTATLYDHGKGHVIPWDPPITQIICTQIRQLLSRAQEDLKPQ